VNYSLTDITRRFEQFAPPNLAPFDYVGLLLGNSRKSVGKIGLTLDFSLLAMQQAVKIGCDALITHHGPRTFDAPLHGNMAEKIRFCTEQKLPVYRAHLNLDFCDGGIIETLAEMLGLATQPTILRFGEHIVQNGVSICNTPIPLSDVLLRAKRLRSTTLRMAGPRRKTFRRFAITSGQGFFETFFGQLAPFDLYIAGEFEQEAVRAAEDMRITLLELGHHASEARPLELIAPRLSNVLGVDVVFIETPDSIRSVEKVEEN
jgi:dinuclear metal center YbgI/SA1388 family protein